MTTQQAAAITDEVYDPNPERTPGACPGCRSDESGRQVVDILEGRNAGCTYLVAVTAGAATKEELAPHGPTHIIHHLSEITTLFSERVQPII